MKKLKIFGGNNIQKLINKKQLKKTFFIMEVKLFSDLSASANVWETIYNRKLIKNLLQITSKKLFFYYTTYNTT